MATSNPQSGGSFVVSLDFELFWGVHDKVSLESWKERLIATRQAIPELLELFETYGIHATWATVGFLFADGREELEAHLPDRRPGYERWELSPYRKLERLGASERDDPFHFAPSLIERIRETPGQELGTHTFSHYYCLEPGQHEDAWRADLRAADRLAEERGVELESLVFPRNQYTDAHVSACAEEGIDTFRGNPDTWYYAPAGSDEESLLRRAFRLLDAHLPVAGAITHDLNSGRTGALNVPASRYLRPWTPVSAPFAGLRRRRIQRELSRAAERGECYHLWWHPHNFGAHTAENLDFLRSILDHVASLRRKKGLRCRTMAEMARVAQ